jgi:hypothetical protein
LFCGFDEFTRGERGGFALAPANGKTVIQFCNFALKALSRRENRLVPTGRERARRAPGAGANFPNRIRIVANNASQPCYAIATHNPGAVKQLHRM